MKKSEAGFSLIDVLVVVVALVIVGSVGWIMRGKGHTTQPPKSNTSYISYSDCISHGGQQLSYDGAIQFDACKGSSSGNLYLQYSAQNMPRIEENKTTTMPNVVVSSASNSPSLVNYLTHNYTGCGIGQPAGSKVTGYYKIAKEIPSGWALLNYGCSNDSSNDKDNAYMIAMKLSSGWVELSPTNNFMPDGTPSCLLVGMFRVPSSLTAQCYQNTGYSDNSLRKVTN